MILAGDDGYWDGLLQWFSTTLVPRGKVRADELDIFKRRRSAGEVVELIRTLDDGRSARPGDKLP